MNRFPSTLAGPVRGRGVKEVELKTAYFWHCETCGGKNFSESVRVEMSDEDAEVAFRQFHEMEDWQVLPDNWRDFELVEIPPTVKCSACGDEFATMNETQA